MEEESWRRNRGGGFLEEESWSRNNGGNHEGIMGEGSWRRDHGRGIAGRHLEASGGILEASWRNMGGILVTSGDILEAWGALLTPRGCPGVVLEGSENEAETNVRGSL